MNSTRAQSEARSTSFHLEPPIAAVLGDTRLIPYHFMASIRQMPSGKWRALIRRPGRKPICITLPTRAAVQKRAREIESMLDRGEPVDAGGAITVAAAITKYRALRESSRPILDTANEHYMLNHLEDGMGELVVTAMKPEDLVGFAQRRREEGAGPYTINMEVSKLGTVLRYAGAALGKAFPDVIGQSRPLLWHLHLIGGGGKRQRRPTEDEFVRLLAYLRELPSENAARYADAVAFCATSTLRRGEVCRIVWADVDEAQQRVLVRDRKHPRKKVGNNVLVTLTAEAWAILARQPREGDRCFPIHPQTLTKHVTEGCRRLGIPDLHLHDMRHEGHSRLFEAGYDIPEVAALTGGEDWRNLKRYTQIDPTKVRH